jgi:hypothetical protein
MLAMTRSLPPQSPARLNLDREHALQTLRPSQRPMILGNRLLCSISGSIPAAIRLPFRDNLRPQGARRRKDPRDTSSSALSA